MRAHLPGAPTVLVSLIYSAANVKERWPPSGVNRAKRLFQSIPDVTILYSGASAVRRACRATATGLLFLFENDLASVSAERDRLKREIAELRVEGSLG